VAHKQYEIEVWGTILFIDATSSTLDSSGIDAAIELVKVFFYRVDQEFSTYKERSYVSQLRRGEIQINDCPAEVIEVWNACAVASELTEGAFNPWSVPGGFDPSGYVKGWAADKCADILVSAGCENLQVNAAGDLTLRGGHVEKSGEINPWSIGVTNPDDKLEVLQIFKITDGAIATSGESERGAHIHDPFTGTIAIGAKSATVVGPDGGLADALATALMVSGEEGAAWFRNPDLAEYSAWVIDRHSDTSWGLGPALL
jgi:thiamine biosynthesis lipoprotein